MVYIVGLYVFAYLPVRVEIWLGPSPSLFVMVGAVLLAALVLELVGHRRSGSGSVERCEEVEEDDLSEVTVLELGGVIRRSTF